MTALLEGVSRTPTLRSLLIGFGLLVAAIVTLGIQSVNTMRAINGEANRLFTDYLLPIAHIKEADAHLFDIERSLKRMIIAKSPVARAEAQGAVALGEQALGQELALASAGITAEANIQRLEAIKALYAEYRGNVEHAIAMIGSERPDGDASAEYVLSADFQRVVASTDRLFDEIASSKEEFARARIERAKLLEERGEMLLWALLLVTLAAAGLAVYIFRIVFEGRLKLLGVAAQALSCGNHDITLPHVAQRTPIGDLARALNLIRETLISMNARPAARVETLVPPPDAIMPAAEPAMAEPTKALPKRSIEVGIPSSPLARSTHAYLHELGVSLYLRGELGDAEVPLRSALVLLPESGVALANLAKVFYGRGALRGAETCLRRALRLSPFAEETLYFLSVTLASTGRVDEAEIYQHRLLVLNPWHEGALLLMKHFLTQKGRFDQAEKCLRRVLAITPNSAAALSGLPELRRMTPADAEWMETAERLASVVLPGEEVQLRYSMGKYCDDTGDYTRAFGNYARANELSKVMSGNPYDGLAAAAGVDQLIACNPKSRAGLLHNGASVSDRPVFVVGMPRSGTSLVEQILASHPLVFGAGELTFWRNAKDLLLPGAVLDAALTEETLQRLATRYLDHLATFTTDAARVVDKMPDNFIHLGLIHAAFPNAKFIHTQRHPIDTCLSIYFQSFSAAYRYASDLADLAHYYREYHRLMAHWRGILPEGSMLELRYEDLLADQEGVSRRMVEFVGLDWDERCLNYQDTQRRVATASKWQVRQKLYTTSVARWRHYEAFIAPLKELEDLA